METKIELKQEKLLDLKNKLHMNTKLLFSNVHFVLICLLHVGGEGSFCHDSEP